MKTCTEPGCERPFVARGYCKPHYYSRLWRKGRVKRCTTLPGEPRRWIEQVSLTIDTDDCVLWPFGRTKKGYGYLSWGRRTIQAHRKICELAHGPPPTPDLDAAHGCGNPPCVNRRHLRWATKADNSADKHLHGTAQIGENNPHAKLNDDAVRTIRRSALTKSQSEIAATFGVSPATVSKILLRRSWAHVPEESV